ncbi:hypothetical protein [Buchananella felis]|uniref:hypothetical protein n=1 Tax=Buchananella felis TaxID=3231492 RepID=UPI00352894EF
MSPRIFTGMLAGFVLVAPMSIPAVALADATAEPPAAATISMDAAHSPVEALAPEATGPSDSGDRAVEPPAPASIPVEPAQDQTDSATTPGADAAALSQHDQTTLNAPGPATGTATGEGGQPDSTGASLAPADTGPVVDTRTPAPLPSPGPIATLVPPTKQAPTTAHPLGPVQPAYYAEVKVVNQVMPQGGQITLTGSGFGPNETVVLKLLEPERPLGQATTNADGDFRATFTMPADAVGFVFISATSPSNTGAHNVHARIYPPDFPIGDFGVINRQTSPNRFGKVVLASRTGCTVNVLLQNELPGDYRFFAYDDGEPVVSVPVNFPAGGSRLQTVSFVITRDVGTKVEGYGLSLRSLLDFTIHAINWDFEGSNQIIARCAASASPSATPSQGTTPTPTPSPSETPTMTPSESTTPTMTPSESTTPSPSQTPTPTPTSSPSLAPSESGTPSQSPTQSQTTAPSESAQPTAPAPSATPTSAPTTPSATPTPAPTTPSALPSQSPLPSKPPTPTPSKPRPPQLARTGTPLELLALLSAGFVASGYALRKRRR